MHQLSAKALDAVEEAVRAVVAHDDTRLSVLAPNTGDLYLWTRRYGVHGTVELVMPPGPAYAVADRHDRHDRWRKERRRRHVDEAGRPL